MHTSERRPNAVGSCLLGVHNEQGNITPTSHYGISGLYKDNGKGNGNCYNYGVLMVISRE